jgi:hypothetical protein
VISAVTKSGGNAFHGEGHYYFSGSPFNSSPVQRLVLSPVDTRRFSYFQDAEQPIIATRSVARWVARSSRDRLFFFGSISPRYVRPHQRIHKFLNGAETGEHRPEARR